jgi:hypothetical protein
MGLNRMSIGQEAPGLRLGQSDPTLIVRMNASIAKAVTRLRHPTTRQHR